MEKYSSYKDSGVKWLGEIPSHWETIKSKYIWQEQFATSENGTEELLSVSQYDGVTPSKGDSRSESLKGYKIVKENDLVINIMLAWLGGLGVSKHNGIVSPAYCTYKMTGGANPHFLHYLYKTPLYLSEFARHSTGVVPSRWRMYTDDFGQVLTLLPPKSEQDAIVSYLDSVTTQIDVAIEQQKKMIELLNERKQIIINNAVTKGLDPNVKMKDSGVDWIGEIPEGWEVRRFKAVAEVKANLVHPENYPNLYQIAPDNIFKNSGVLHDVKTVHDSGVISDNHLFHKGQILYSKIRPNLNKVVIAPYEGLCCADMYPIETKLNTEYLQKYMLSKCFTDQVTLVIMDRVKMPKINKEELGQILVICPTTDEQKQIVHTINKEHEALDIAINYAEQQIALLQERKQIIINEVVTGKVKVS